MSQRPISHSADLKKLQDEGYDLEIRSGYLLVKDVPYTNSSREVKRGTLVLRLILAGDVTARPDDHVAHFIGSYPCRDDGREIEQIRNQSTRRALAQDVVIDHTFSAKPKPADNYEDYYAKVTTYVAIICQSAAKIDPTLTAKTFPVLVPENDKEGNVFNYIDTASSRAEINVVTRKLELEKVAILGLGGTGSYVLDLVAKTPVRQIHLFDGDTFFQHNAFRSPGAPSVDTLKTKVNKSVYFAAIYSNMHRGIISHEEYIGADNVEQLREMTFVFLCLDHGVAKRLIIEQLEAFRIPFVDVGMGIYVSGTSLGGILRITTSTPERRDHVRTRISFSGSDANNEYARNIQIADLNALNASLAVIKWKKLFGFYLDLEREHHCTYTIDGNKLINEDCFL